MYQGNRASNENISYVNLKLENDKKVAEIELNEFAEFA